jgi:hypothetical protein
LDQPPAPAPAAASRTTAKCFRSPLQSTYDNTDTARCADVSYVYLTTGDVWGAQCAVAPCCSRVMSLLCCPPTKSAKGPVPNARYPVAPHTQVTMGSSFRRKKTASATLNGRPTTMTDDISRACTKRAAVVVVRMRHMDIIVRIPHKYQMHRAPRCFSVHVEERPSPRTSEGTIVTRSEQR